ncbi:plasmid replication protein RepC [Amaricoccus sp. W119]|uniref:plasmid replication protein RepC n=1 Tax=Amaricoccus sp. W119 TaxID=3391833 RepID=UPI0039A6F6C9
MRHLQPEGVGALLARVRPVSPCQSPTCGTKWSILRDLAVGRASFGLNDRDVSVLQALLTFCPDSIFADTGAPIVHASNRSICDRLNGMPVSTLRRHIAKLVAAGVIDRRDSPNGKRYVRRTLGERDAFGFDLSPFRARFKEFSSVAAATTHSLEQTRASRHRIGILRRDLVLLAARGRSAQPELSVWDECADLATDATRLLRRKLALDELSDIEDTFFALVQRVQTLLDLPGAGELSANDSQNERHIQNTKDDVFESTEQRSNLASNRLCETKLRKASNPARAADEIIGRETPPTLSEVLSACPDYSSFAPSPITDWTTFILQAERLRSMMGIAEENWHRAKNVLGHQIASVVLAGMLQRFGEIRFPNAYLQSLSAKATRGLFSVVPMIAALQRRAYA